uniref:Sulfotransferase domain-containing protein n=1 Tax=Chromulina nebulosa TaxID=96789 RepID=A0A7S0SXH6_9STRA
MSSHPSVLPSLCGGSRPRYLLNNHELRDQCIPFIEENEKYSVLDHSQLYASDQMIPMRITEDNINTRVVFAVRHPVERFIEQYLSLSSRRINDSNVSLRSILNDMYNKDSKYSHLRQLVTNGSSDEVIRLYYLINNNDNLSYTDMLFSNSVYYPIVLHFTNQLTSRNVLIVDGFNDSLNQIFNYLGFCSFSHTFNKITSSLQLQSVIADSEIANEELSQDIYSQLNLFFEPFITSLMSLTNVNLTYWIKSEPPDYLPLFSIADNNKSSPAQWFESSLSPLNVDSGIMSHLLPKGKSSTDERFNTTLGMLISF